MKSCNFFLICFLTCSHFLSFSQDSLQQGGSSYLKSYLLDTRDIFIAPVQWSRGEALAAFSVAATGAVLFTQDKSIQAFFQRNRSVAGDNCTIYGMEPWGSGLYSMSTMALFYLHGLAFNNDRSTRTALLGLKTYIITGLVLRIPKQLAGRHRPHHDMPPDPKNWEGPVGYSSHFTSFPSGHTVSVFAVATIVASEYKNTPWVPLLSYTIATATGVSRMYDNKHWASDVFIGAAMGFAMGKLIYKRNNWRVKKSKK